MSGKTPDDESVMTCSPMPQSPPHIPDMKSEACLGVWFYRDVKVLIYYLGKWMIGHETLLQSRRDLSARGGGWGWGWGVTIYDIT